MNFLVLGGTGTVGSQVVRLLLARKADVAVLTRTPDKAKALPSGARGVVGDLMDVGTIRTAFQGRDAVFLLNGLSPAETQEGLLALNGARLAGVKRIVYLSIHNLESASHLPHFGAKVAIEKAIQSSGIPYTILRPNHFYQNDYWMQEPMLKHGVYPQPIGGVGISRVDVRDIAEAAVLALTGESLVGKTLSLVGPTAWTGDAAAEAWSQALGRKIAYGGEDMDAWEQQAAQFFPPWLAFDIRMMYEHFQRHGLKATPQEIETLTKVLGHPPRRFEDFARETAEAWTRSAGGVVA